MIQRRHEEELKKYLFKGKAILVYGPRQTGKTTLIRTMLKSLPEKYLHVNGDEYDVRQMFLNSSSSKLRTMTAGYQILFIDEAQKINDIGTIIKLFTDSIPEVQVIATGSSSFEMMNAVSESLTGRKYEFVLLPVSFSEMIENSNVIEEKRMIEQRLIFGSYPEIVMNPGQAKMLLKLLVSSYLYKDIFALDNIKSSSTLEKLVSAVAYQVGSEVSYTELAQTAGADKKTVEKYLNILEQAFILFKLNAYSGNLRNEIKKGKKYYFYDNGVRNAILGDFTPLTSRTDIGALWENYLVSERRKHSLFIDSDAKPYFWRTMQQQEIDYIEKTPDGMYAYEIKWSEKARAAFPVTFTNAYPVIEKREVNRKNYEAFLMPEQFGF